MMGWFDKMDLISNYQYKKFLKAFKIALKNSNIHNGDMTRRHIFVNIMNFYNDDLKGLSINVLANSIVNLHKIYHKQFDLGD